MKARNVYGSILLFVAVMTFGTMASAGTPVCPADVNDDNVVNVMDLTEVILQWGPCVNACTADTDNNGVVNVMDLTNVILMWGPCPSNECPYVCGDPLGCLFSGGYIHEEYECDAGVCCETIELEPCPYTCMPDPFSCADASGNHEPDFMCDGSQVCCDIPVLDPCPYDCVSDSFQCMLQGGTLHDGFSCASSGACCQL